MNAPGWYCHMGSQGRRMGAPGLSCDQWSDIFVMGQMAGERAASLQQQEGIHPAYVFPLNTFSNNAQAAPIHEHGFAWGLRWGFR